MITYKPIIIQGGRRKDGTYPVKIRVTFKGKVRRLPTTLLCTAADLTRAGHIKNGSILEKAGELIARMRAACADLSPFTLEAWDVDAVVAHITRTLTRENFRLDFFDYGERFIARRKPHTGAVYGSALNMLADFLGRRSLDVNDISKGLLLDFIDYAETTPRTRSTADGRAYLWGRPKTGGTGVRYAGKLSAIFNAAKREYNDEDAGVILIPRSPFADLPRRTPPAKGQQPQDPAVIQAVIDAEPRSETEGIALALFVVSFCTMGANLADLWGMPAPRGDILTYNRQKTTDHRDDGAEVRVRLSPRIRPFVAALQGDGPARGWWLPALARWKNADRATNAVNYALHRWQERNGLPRFSFYAARHTWGTLAREMGIEKATVDEGLAHVGDYRVADIYARRNWALAWEANDRVLDLFLWPE